MRQNWSFCNTLDLA